MRITRLRKPALDAGIVADGTGMRRLLLNRLLLVNVGVLAPAVSTGK
jgi:hypothetical protein